MPFNTHNQKKRTVMNKYKRLISNTTILGIGTFSSKLLVFFLVRFYTACLSKAEYGVADIITQTANLLIPVLSLGLFEAIFRLAMDDEENGKRIFSSGLALILTNGVIFAFLIPVIDMVDMVSGYGWLIVLYVITSCINSICAQYVRAKGQMKLFALKGIIGTLIIIALNLLFLLVFDMGVTGYVLSIVISDFICSVIVFLSARLWREVDFSLVEKKTVSRMLSYSIPLIPTTILWWITNVADRYILMEMMDASVTGLYTVSYKIPTMLTLVSGIFIEAWQFSAVKERSDGDKEHALFFSVTFDNFQALMFVAGTFLIAFSKIATRIMADPSYFESWRYIPVLSLATVFSALVTFMGVIYLMEKKSMMSFYTALVGAALNIILNLILIPTPLGANGAAIATFASYFVVFIIRAAQTRRYIKFKMNIFALVANTAILILQCAVILSGVGNVILLQAVCVICICAINCAPLMKTVRFLLRRGR